jgi:hypothetical protein
VRNQLLNNVPRELRNEYLSAIEFAEQSLFLDNASRYGDSKVVAERSAELAEIAANGQYGPAAAQLARAAVSAVYPSPGFYPPYVTALRELFERLGPKTTARLAEILESDGTPNSRAILGRVVDVLNMYPELRLKKE